MTPDSSLKSSAGHHIKRHAVLELKQRNIGINCEIANAVELLKPLMATPHEGREVHELATAQKKL